MVKHKELSDPTSCLSKAASHELVFVLIQRDVAAPSTIRAWVDLRLAYGKNKPDDPQILEALAVAKEMDDKRKSAKEQRIEEYRRKGSA